MRKEQTAKQSAFLELDASVRKIDAKDAKGDAKLPRRTPHARQGGSTRRYGHPRSRHGNSIADLRSFPSQLSRRWQQELQRRHPRQKRSASSLQTPPINVKPLPSNTRGGREGAARSSTPGKKKKTGQEEEDANECRLEFHITSLPLASTLRHLYSVNTHAHTLAGTPGKKMVGCPNGTRAERRK